MNPDYLELEVLPLATRWWALVVRGLAAIAFGILAMLKPSAGLLALVVVWGAYAIVDGLLRVALSIRGARVVRGWGWLLAGGLVGIAAGVFTFLRPGITALALLVVIAGWAVLTGIAEIATAVRLRRVMHGEWMLAASGVLSIVFGLLVAMMPGAGALAITWLVALYAIVLGGLLVGVGFRLHRWAEIAGHPAHA